MKKLYIAPCLVIASLSTSAFADSSIGSDNGDWKAWKRIALNKANDDYMVKPMQLFSHSNLSTAQQL